MTIDWFFKFEEAQSSTNTTKNDLAFTWMIIECKGSKGCSPEYSKIIDYLYVNNAWCINSPTLKYVYDSRAKTHNYKGFDEKADMQRLCSNIDFEPIGICSSDVADTL